MTPNRDGVVRIAPIIALAAAAYSADNTPDALDVRGFQSASLLLNVGIGGITFTGANKIEFVLSHSDDGTTFTNVTDDDVIKDSLASATITNGIIRALTSAHAAATLQKIGYVGGKGWLRLLADFSGTHGSPTPISAVLIRSRADLFGVA